MDDLGWSYHLFLETSKWIPGIWMICLKLPGWNQGCHVTSIANPRSRISQFTKNRYWASMLLVGSDSPPEVLDPPKKNSEIECLNDLDGPLVDKAMLFLSVANIAHDLHNLCVYTLHRNKISRTFEANPVSKVAALCGRLVVVGPKHIPKHIARAILILNFSLMPSWQQQRLAAEPLLIILW